MHSGDDRPHIATCFSPVIYFTTFQRCPAGYLRSMKSKYRSGRNGGSGLHALRARPRIRDLVHALAAFYWPGRMSFDFSAVRAEAAGEPGVQIGEGAPEDSGVQISP